MDALLRSQWSLRLPTDSDDTRTARNVPLPDLHLGRTPEHVVNPMAVRESRHSGDQIASVRNEVRPRPRPMCNQRRCEYSPPSLPTELLNRSSVVTLTIGVRTTHDCNPAQAHAPVRIRCRFLKSAPEVQGAVLSQRFNGSIGNSMNRDPMPTKPRANGNLGGGERLGAMLTGNAGLPEALSPSHDVEPRLMGEVARTTKSPLALSDGIGRAS